MEESNGQDFPLGRLIGMSIERPSPGRAVSRVPSSPDLLNPHGFVHGGVVFILVDTSMGAAVMSMLPEGKRCSTIECQVRYLRSVVDADLVCETVVSKPGRNIFHLESRVSTGDGVLVATGTGSFAVLRIMANLLREDETGPAEAAYKAAAQIARAFPNA